MRKVAVIGLDSTPLDLILKWQDSLPNLKTLMSLGTYGELESTIPPITVPAWMSMMTGKSPGTLGIYGFRNRVDHSYDNLVVASSEMVTEPAVWDVLGEKGYSSILIGVPLTYPLKPIRGWAVADFLAPGTDVDYTYPSALREEIADTVGEYIIDVDNFRSEDRSRILQQIFDMTEKRFGLARHFLMTKEWDFFVMVEMGTDRVQHAFWQDFDPFHVLYRADSPFASAVHDYYKFLDRKIGEILDVLPAETLVLIVSDHGAQRMDGAICLNEWLIREGYLTLKEYPAKPTPFSKLQVDWTKTVAWGDGGYYGRVFLNVKGREPQGIVAPNEYEKIRAEIAAKLENLGDGNGHSIGTKVFKPEDIYPVVRNVPPDLIVYFGNLFWRSAGTVGHGTIHLRENDTGPDGANHAQEGIFIGALKQRGGWRVPVEWKDGPVSGLRIYDMAPTIISYYGLPLPAGIEGEQIKLKFSAASD